MSLRSVQNEVIHLMQNDNYDVRRRDPIVKVLETFLNSKHYIDIVGVAIKNQKQDSVIKISQIPKLINIIISCVSSMRLSKTLTTPDMKYYIYGILYSFITNEDPQLFEDVQIETFENLYDGMYDLILMAPTVVEVGSTLCKVFC